MENKIQLRFKLNNLEKVGFAAKSEHQEILEWLEKLQNNGIEIKSDFYDDLCKSTISNGHNLLKSKGIFNIDSSVIGPMAKIIGQYLFRLLFGTSDFRDYLHLARREKKELEIILEFDNTKDDSKSIMNLPWELMYCPERRGEGNGGEKEDGFFVSQTASIYRKYKNVDGIGTAEKRKVNVSVAFLTKDIENVKVVHQKYKDIADIISKKNNNLNFHFANSINEETKNIDLLSKEDLGKIFLDDKNIDASGACYKIVHLICDISVAQYDDEGGNPKYEKALYFNKTGNEAEAIRFTEVFKVLFNKNVLQDPNLKLLVLQAWNDENNYAYSGFEEMANKMISKHQTAILSMPYLMNQKSADGRSTFFQTFYESLANGSPIIEAVQKIRNDIVPKFSYGFPLLYLNGQNEALVSKENIVFPTGNTNLSGNSENERLTDREKLLLEKKNDFELDRITTSDSDKKFQLKKDIEKIDIELAKILEEKKKYSPISIRRQDH